MSLRASCPCNIFLEPCFYYFFRSFLHLRRATVHAQTLEKQSFGALESYDGCQKKNITIENVKASFVSQSHCISSQCFFP